LFLKALRSKLSSKKKGPFSPRTFQIEKAPAEMGYEFTVYKGGKDGLVKSTTHRDELKDSEVYVQVTHSGICGTDRFYRGADMVLGHEGVGVVKQIGPGVKSLKV
jgi:NADPH:quinone reductase-like Zn-dependent oxidoreductase